MKQRARYLGFLFAESKQKQIESFKLKLPRIDRNNQFSTLVSNEKSNYVSNGNPGRRSTISEQQLSSRSRQNFKAQT